MKNNNFLQALHKKRSADVKVLNQYKGIKKTLTLLYPDKAHFIYELMQNAEDTTASEITFRLSPEKLVFEHNGKPFTKKNVWSITDIGDSSKGNDDTSIGKFGVGFKAVFIYTNTPIVYSGRFAFKIFDLIVPEPITPLSKNTSSTIFEFPFNNPKKSPEFAISQIEEGLCALGDNTLLFLSHIRKITYTLPDGSEGSLQRIDHKNGRIEIHTQHPHSDNTISHWLHFYKDVDVTDDEGESKTCRIAIAYQLEQNKEKSWKIVPVTDGGQVSIYFPAEKEPFNLHFHLHAPFASTVARDSVRDCPENDALRDYIAGLIVESLTAIRDQGLLNMSFLAVLPNPKDNLSAFYKPIREKIVEAFNSRELTPTKSRKYAKAENLYRGGLVKVSDTINDADLKFLTDDKKALWVANPPPQRQREDNFLNSLEIKDWGFGQLTAIFKPEDKEKIESWLEKKNR